jgi:hypothetical protein
MVRSRPANKDGVLDTADLRLIGLMITGTVPVNLAADCNQDGSVSAADVACASAKIVAIRLNPQSYVAPTGGLLLHTMNPDISSVNTMGARRPRRSIWAIFRLQSSLQRKGSKTGRATTYRCFFVMASCKT